jgi:2-phospho-L-lactate guanylyltransferase
MNPLVLVPVKAPSLAKSRMASVLTSSERADLALAMLNDVARALAQAGPPVAVLTSSGQAAELASRNGWRVMWETTQSSESDSVDAASRELAREGVEAVLCIPADVPLVEPSDIEALMRQDARLCSTTLVPSYDFRGTNAILRSPPDLFPSRFGFNSLVLHLQEALRAGADCRVWANPRLACDLDDPADMVRFMARPSETETYFMMHRGNLSERLSSWRNRTSEFGD